MLVYVVFQIIFSFTNAYILKTDPENSFWKYIICLLVVDILEMVWLYLSIKIVGVPIKKIKGRFSYSQRSTQNSTSHLNKN